MSDLTKNEADWILFWFEAGDNIDDLAKKYGLSKEQINRLIDKYYYA